MSAQPGKLYLIPCPLSENAPQQTLPAIIPETIKNLQFYLVENVRTARRFISSLKTGAEIESLQFTVLDKDTEAKAIEPVFTLLLQGHNVGVLSEAGCPGIADPGSLAVKTAHQKNIEVVPLTGPSSILLALMASGASGQSFVFHGYLPIEKTARQKAILQLEKDALQKKQTQVFIETPYRNNNLLADILQVSQGQTMLCVAANITSPEQFLKSKTMAEWKKITVDLNKRPTVFIIF